MEYYKVIGGADGETFVRILKEFKNGFDIEIIRVYDGYRKKESSFIKKELFYACIRTGYMQKIEDRAFSISA